jgi:S1-C subfamily serine protease
MGALRDLSSDVAAAVSRAAPAVVAVNARPRLASTGVHWRAGAVVTAEHTVRVDDEITVTRADGVTVPATLAGRDPSTDLAVLKVADGGWSTADLGDPARLRLGDIVLALGRGPSVSSGVVSRLGGGWRTARGGHIDQLIGLDLTMYPGFSGGPLVDAEGRVVGVNTSALSRHRPLAIPAATVDRVASELLRSGRIARGYLGIGMQAVRLPESVRRRLPHENASGVIVLGVEAGSPAAAAGIVLGDILVALGETPVADTDDVQKLLGSDRVGVTLTASLVRGGEPIQLAITIGERPPRTR